MKEKRRRYITEKIRFGNYYIDADTEKVYITHEYPIDKFVLMGDAIKTYKENGPSLIINNEEDKDVISAVAVSYSSFISIEESKSVVSDIYNYVEKLQKNGILDAEVPTSEIVEAFVAPAIEQDNHIVAWRWFVCDTDWYMNNVVDYINDEYKYDFLRCVGFMKIINGTDMTTKDYFQAVKWMNDLTLENEQKHTYIFQDTTGLYMVGHSKEIPERFKTIKQGNTTLKVIAELNGDFVKEIYKNYANKRVQGIWFKLSGEDIKNIKSTFVS